MPVRYQLPLSLLLLIVSAPVWAFKKVDLDYRVTLLPQSNQAQVSITLEQGSAVRTLDFDLGEQRYYSDFAGDGQWSTAPAQQGSGLRGIWKPASGKATLTYKVRINRPAANTSPDKPRFDSRMTSDWAVFRGEDLVPNARLDQPEGVRLQSRLSFDLPTGWKSVETAWPRIGKNRFRIDNVSRLFDRPTGWIAAGHLINRRTRLGDTEVTVSAPRGQGMRRMEALTLLTFVWPTLHSVFAGTPGKLLVVSAGDSMAINASAAHDSIFVHSNRPLISESGASPFLRELVRTVGRIRSRDRSDWVGAAIAEYYSVELVRRAGGMSEERYQDWQSIITRVGRKVTSLRGDHADPAITARATLMLVALDQEIRQKTNGGKSLDDLVQGLMRMGPVSTDDVVQLANGLMDETSSTLSTSLLQLGIGDGSSEPVSGVQPH